MKFRYKFFLSIILVSFGIFIVYSSPPSINAQGANCPGLIPCDTPGCSCSGSCYGCPDAEYYSDESVCNGGSNDGLACSSFLQCPGGICEAEPATCHVSSQQCKSAVCAGDACGYFFGGA